MPEPEKKIWTVSEINRILKELIENSLYPFWIAGEVSNLTIHRSGHVYFTLKDDACQLRAVFFSGASAARSIGLEEGMAVEVFGRLSVYEARGIYQVAVRQLRPRGIGALQQQFEELKQKLQREGLFDEARKRPLPALPQCIGVITSPQGAALHDFLQILQRRFANMHVRIFPATVQGPATAAEVIAGIEFFNREEACDLLVVTRGGGSLEDLWGFNDEKLARAIAASRLPVISAVGHQVDFSICDFVADLRAPTPSAAAELAVAQRNELLGQVREQRRRLRHSLELQLSRWRTRLLRAALHPILREPVNLVRAYQQRLDELSSRLPQAMRQQHERACRRFSELHGQLRLLNPRNVLERGYAILIAKANGIVVSRADQVELGAEVHGILAAGELELEVKTRKMRGAHDGT